MAEITQNTQKHIIFIVVPQFRITDGSGFVMDQDLLKKR